jgi:hypothetical protein
MNPDLKVGDRVRFCRPGRGYQVGDKGTVLEGPASNTADDQTLPSSRYPHVGLRSPFAEMDMLFAPGQPFAVLAKFLGLDQQIAGVLGMFQAGPESRDGLMVLGVDASGQLGERVSWLDDRGPVE